jgi:ABC-type transporter MlaC component
MIRSARLVLSAFGDRHSEEGTDLRGWVQRVSVLVMAVAALGASRPAARPADPVAALHAGLVQASAAPGGPSQPAIEALAARSFDMGAITLAVLGDEGRAATPAQKMRLSHVLLVRLARQIALAGRQSASDGFSVAGTQALGGDDWLVTTRELRPATGGAGPQPRDLGWRVRREGARFRIVDTLPQGLSTVGVEHDDFAAQLKGRDIEAVIAQMERRAAAPPPGL